MGRDKNSANNLKHGISPGRQRESDIQNGREIKRLMAEYRLIEIGLS